MYFILIIYVYCILRQNNVCRLCVYECMCVYVYVCVCVVCVCVFVCMYNIVDLRV